MILGAWGWAGVGLGGWRDTRRGGGSEELRERERGVSVRVRACGCKGGGGTQLCNALFK